MFWEDMRVRDLVSPPGPWPRHVCPPRVLRTVVSPPTNHSRLSIQTPIRTKSWLTIARSTPNPPYLATNSQQSRVTSAQSVPPRTSVQLKRRESVSQWLRIPSRMLLKRKSVAVPPNQSLLNPRGLLNIEGTSPSYTHRGIGSNVNSAIIRITLRVDWIYTCADTPARNRSDVRSARVVSAPSSISRLILKECTTETTAPAVQSRGKSNIRASCVTLQLPSRGRCFYTCVTFIVITQRNRTCPPTAWYARVDITRRPLAGSLSTWSTYISTLHRKT